MRKHQDMHSVWSMSLPTASNMHQYDTEQFDFKVHFFLFFFLVLHL